MKIKNKIVLASSSPRRRELFDQYGLDYIVDYVETDEVLDESLTLSKRLENIALQKARPLKNKYPDHIIISGDTMVTYHQQMMGKPKDRQDAKNMLKQLSNHEQIVMSAVCIIDGNQEITFCDETTVIFHQLSEQDIESYLDTNEWIGKAGGYAIQGIAKKFVKQVIGDQETVIGFPMRLIMCYLSEKK